MEKKRIQGEQLSLKQTSTMEDHTKISHIEDRKETVQGKDHLTSKVPQPKTKYRLPKEKIEKKQHKAKYLTGKVPQPKTTEIYPAEKIENNSAKGRVSKGEGSRTDDKRKIMKREDRKETAQGQLSDRQGSTAEDRKIDIA